MPKTSVVILNYNGRDFLSRFLPTLIQYTPRAEICVADNSSTDDSLEVLQQFPDVRKILLPQNYGYAGGYNETLRQLDAEYFLLLNSDIEVTPGWLDPLEDFLNTNPAYAAVQPKILDYNRREYFEYAGGSGGFIDPLGYPYCRGRIFDTLEQDTGQYDDTRTIFWSSGACFMIRSSAFREAGEFDADFFAHMEEIDLCWRLSSRGYKVAVVPSSIVYHVGGGTLSKSNPHKTYLNFRNGIFLLVKNLPAVQLPLVLPVRFVLDMLAGLKFWKEVSFDHTKAVWKAWRSGLSGFQKMYNKREVTSSPTPRGERRFILWKYYINKKKTYSTLNNTR